MASKPSILLVGAGGQIGSTLLGTLAAIGPVTAPTRAELDLERPASIRSIMRALRPAIVVNAAAYTAVDRAECEGARCAAINADAPAVLAEEVARSSGLMVHYSTDYVFDGRSTVPYTEDDIPNPLGVYGRTKLAGEQGVAAAGGKYLIVRTSWVYGAHGSNFLVTMRRLARERRELRVVSDQTGSPTWSTRIARDTATLVAAMHRDVDGRSSGVYHLSSSGSTSWYEFAQVILDGDPQREAQVRERIIPITTAEYGAPAPRPAYSVLDSAKIQRRFGLAIPSWRDELRHVLAELSSSSTT